MNMLVEFINSLNIGNSSIIVACSGGPDSMFLLYILKNMGYNVICAHVNHNVRIESKDEYKFLEKYCNEQNIIFEGIEIKKYKKGKFSEEEAREFRYKYFEEIVKKYHAKYLFTAHHGDDLIETILMRIVRGSSLKGYRGFDIITKKNNYEIIRPLVYMTKEDIEKEIDKLKIPYVIDKTNYEDVHTRNRYRHYVLPFLKKEDKSVHLKFLKFSKKIDECNSYFERELDKMYLKVYDDSSINIKEFMSIDSYLQKKIIEKVLSYMYPDNLYLVSDIHIDSIINLINNTKDNAQIDLPNNIIVLKEYGYIKFKKIDELVFSDYEYTLIDEVEVEDGIIKLVKESDDTSNYCIRLNSNDIKLPLIVRNRRDSDRIQIKNLNGTKKINDIFIDCKIDKEKRNSLPIVVDSNNTVVWIPGIKKSNLDIPINNSYDIIVKYEKRR